MVFIDTRKRLYPAIMIFLITIVFSTGGCSSTSKKEDNATAPASSPNAVASAQYYDFDDVLVPEKLKVDKKSSFTYKTEEFTAGVLVLRGRVETGSLISFFETNMVNDNWSIISSFKSKRTMLLYQKAHRWCVINITDGEYNTFVEIWVAPTTKGT